MERAFDDGCRGRELAAAAGWRGLVLLAMLAALTGCGALGPRVVATADTVQYTRGTSVADRMRGGRPPEPVTLVKVLDGGRTLRVAQWQRGRDGQAQVSLRGQDPRACYAALDVLGRPVPVRDNERDRYSFRLPRHADAARLQDEWQQAAQVHERLRTAAANERRQLADAQRWLETSGWYRAGQCLQPAPAPLPLRPAGACAPGESRSHGEGACWGSFVMGYGCDKARTMMGATSGLAALAGSVGCSSLAAMAQGEQLTLEGWLADVLIDGTMIRCIEGLADGRDLLGNGLCAMMFVPLFAVKMQACIDQSANRCSQSWYGWEREATNVREFPARTVATCQAHVRRVAAGDGPVQAQDDQASQAAVRLQQSRARLDDAQRSIGITDLTEHPCGT